MVVMKKIHPLSCGPKNYIYNSGMRLSGLGMCCFLGQGWGSGAAYRVCVAAAWIISIIVVVGHGVDVLEKGLGLRLSYRRKNYLHNS
jgi:hypothetical protein